MGAPPTALAQGAYCMRRRTAPALLAAPTPPALSPATSTMLAAPRLWVDSSCWTVAVITRLPRHWNPPAEQVLGAWHAGLGLEPREGSTQLTGLLRRSRHAAEAQAGHAGVVPPAKVLARCAGHPQLAVTVCDGAGGLYLPLHRPGASRWCSTRQRPGSSHGSEGSLRHLHSLCCRAGAVTASCVAHVDTGTGFIHSWKAYPHGWMVISGMPLTDTPASVVAGSSFELIKYGVPVKRLSHVGVSQHHPAIHDGWGWHEVPVPSHKPEHRHMRGHLVLHICYHLTVRDTHLRPGT